MEREYQTKLSDALAQVEYYEIRLNEDISLKRRIEEFKEALDRHQVLEEFDRGVFESIIDKVIVGGYDEDGNVDPYRITFIYKNGFSDSVNNSKARFEAKKKCDTELCSETGLQVEKLCYETSDDTASNL